MPVPQVAITSIYEFPACDNLVTAGLKEYFFKCLSSKCHCDQHRRWNHQSHSDRGELGSPSNNAFTDEDKNGVDRT